MAFEYGEQRDDKGNIIHQGSWSGASSPKVIIEKIAEDVRTLKDDRIVDAGKLNGKTDNNFAPSGFGLGSFGTNFTEVVDTKTFLSRSYVQSGFYRSNSITDLPNQKGHTLLVDKADTGFATVIAISVEGEHKLYSGRIAGGEWSGWKSYAPDGYGLGDIAKYLGAGFDLNNLNKCGFYAGNSLINAPSKDGYNIIHTEHATGNLYSAQIAMCVEAGRDILVRKRTYGVWSGWEQAITNNCTCNISFAVDNAYSIGENGKRASQIYAASPTINTSDRNAKTDIVPTALGLDFINKLNPVEYKFKVRQNVIEQVEDGTETIEIPAKKDEDGKVIEEPKTEVRKKYKEVIVPQSGKRTHVGLIAQDVEQALGRDLGVFTKDAETGMYGLRYEELVPVLIKAVQELSQEVNKLKAKKAAE